MDFGPLALLDTIQVLEQVGIGHFGAGETLTQAVQPPFLQLGSARVAFLGFDGIAASWYGTTSTTPGTAPLDADLVIASVEAAKREADIVIAFFHSGIEYTLVPTQQQRELAHRTIDAGATLVVGSHPHWVQGVEWDQGRPIFSSLGNFVFDQEWSLETKQGLIRRLWFAGSTLRRYQLVPVLIENYHRPRLARGDEAITIAKRIRAPSQQIREVRSRCVNLVESALFLCPSVSSQVLHRLTSINPVVATPAHDSGITGIAAPRQDKHSSNRNG